MEISIIDPGMFWHAGHNRQMNIALAKELLKRGFIPTIYCHRDYQPIQEESSFGFNIVPLFSANPYGQDLLFEKGISATGLDMQIAKRLREELKQVNLGHLGISPTLWPYMVLAASEIPNFRFIGCIHHHPDISIQLGEVRWRFAFTKAAQKLNALSFCVVEPDLQKAFDKIIPRKTKISIAPFPVEIGDMPSQASSSGRIGILGGLRMEQGQSYLPDIVNAILGNGFKVLLQDSQGKLETAAHPDVEILGQIEKMETVIAGCEALVLHYSPVYYGKMGSGLMWESILHGVPTLHTNNTLPGKIAQRLGAGVTFDFGDITSFSDALRVFRGNKIAIQNAARHAAVKARKEHGISNFVDHIMKYDAWPKGL